MKQVIQLTLCFLFASMAHLAMSQPITDIEGDVVIGGASNFTRLNVKTAAGLTGGIDIQGGGVGADTRLSLFNVGVQHDVYDDYSDNRALIIKSGADLKLRTGNVNRFWINQDGRFGLGGGPIADAMLRITSETGTRALSLVGAAAGTTDLAIEMNNGGGTHYIFDDADDGNALELESANGIHFNTGGPFERVEIGSTGTIGINVPASGGARQWVETGGESWCIYSIAKGTEANKYGLFGRALDYDAINNYYGVYGASSSSGSNSWAGYFNGDLRYTGALVGPSDRTLKQNIRDIPTVLDKVMQLTPVSYEMKRDAYPGLNLAEGPQVGFISQDVEALFPDFVQDVPHVFASPGKDSGEQGEINIKSLTYISFIPVLTKAIQEQQLLINELTTKLEHQQSEIEKLKNRQ